MAQMERLEPLVTTHRLTSRLVKPIKTKSSLSPTAVEVGQVAMITPTQMVQAAVEQGVLARLLELVAILLSKAQRLATR